MKELLIILAKTMSEDMLINKLEEAILEYKAIKTKESKKNLSMTCILALTKFSTENRDMESVLKEYKQQSETLRMFKNKKQ